MSDKASEGGEVGFRSGFVALIGRPNVGKSTLLNALTGQKIAITSAKPQTTRNRISGIVNRPGCQLIFIDTPGMHQSPRLMNVHMNREASSAISEVDAVVMLVDGASGRTPGDDAVAQKVAGIKIPVILGINKIDTGRTHADKFDDLLPSVPTLELSATSGLGVEDLLEALARLMPEGPRYYEEDELTDRPERYIAEEFIREKIFALTGEEVPYSTAVTVDNWEEKPDKNLVVIHATVHVERPSQKAIIIGQGGAMAKKIGRSAREDLEGLLGVRVYLDLHVGVEKNWTKDENQLRRFGLAPRKESKA